MDTVYVPTQFVDEQEIMAETDEVNGDLDELITDILHGFCPYRVIEVDTYEHDVSKLVAQEVIARAWDLDIEITQEVKDFALFHGVSVPADVRVSNLDGNR